jgi:hypothetical protein
MNFSAKIPPHRQAVTVSGYSSRTDHSKKIEVKILQSLFFFSFCLLFSDIYGQFNTKLAEKIDSLYTVDQSVQTDIQKAFEKKVPFDSVQKLQTIEKGVFDRHIPIIKQIIAENGYPTIKKVGADASHHFFALIQHSDSDPAFQVSLLPILKKLADKGEIQKKDYAFLYDRVQRNMGKKQLYGTQLSFDSKGNLFDSTNKIIIPKDLTDPANVDKRRAKMGLEPLEQYYETVLQTLGRPRKKE